MSVLMVSGLSAGGEAVPWFFSFSNFDESWGGPRLSCFSFQSFSLPVSSEWCEFCQDKEVFVAERGLLFSDRFHLCNHQRAF